MRGAIAHKIDTEWIFCILFFKSQKRVQKTITDDKKFETEVRLMREKQLFFHRNYNQIPKYEPSVLEFATN